VLKSAADSVLGPSAVIVSNDRANRYADRVSVIPLASQTAMLYPGQATVTVERKDSKRMADQIMTLS
jgi:mRNA-degrading endonuclease toxin of MazEF toxin-antitoxin module